MHIKPYYAFYIGEFPLDEPNELTLFEHVYVRVYNNMTYILTYLLVDIVDEVRSVGKSCFRETRARINQLART